MWLLWFGKRSWKWGLCVDDRAVGEGRKIRAGLLLSRLQGELKEVRGWSWFFGWGEVVGREVVCREEMGVAALFFKRENDGLFLLVGRGEPGDVVWGKRDRGGGDSLLFWRRWVCRVRGFFVFFFNVSKLPPSSCVSCGPIFIGKMLLGPQNWSLNFSFFQNFDFSCIFWKWAISTSTQWEKSMLLKMTREKSNAFEKHLKI